MGNFFTNLQIRASKKTEVVKALKQILTAPCYVSRSSGGWVSAYPKETENQDLEALRLIARQISENLGTHAFCFIVNDDTILGFSLYGSGELVGDFDNQWSVFGGTDHGFGGPKEPTRPIEAASLLPLCKKGVTEAQIREWLYPKSRLMEAVDEIIALAELLGIPEDRIVVGFDYVEEGGSELDHEAERITLLEIGNEESVQYSPEDWTAQLFEVGIVGASRSLEKISSSIANGADPNGRNADGMTPLVFYSMYCLTEHMRALIDAGADVNLFSRCSAAWDDGKHLEELTPLMVVCSLSVDHSNQLLDAARLLIRAGADMKLPSSAGHTTLQMAEEMTDWTKWKKRIGRLAPEPLLREAAHRSEQLVEILKGSDAPIQEPEPPSQGVQTPRFEKATWWTD